MPKRDPYYDILFEPVQIGPVTARNRFYQVPHCNGMGYLRPKTLAAMRGIKAEGGWAVVCTEEVEIHATSDNGLAAEGRLWDDADIPALTKMTEAVHEHGALAGIELVHGGYSNSNHYSRIPPIAPSMISVNSYDPVQARSMTKSDIRNFRKWHRQAALRAKQADFDLVYVYAGHSLTLLMHFLSPRFNQRTDEYGGSLENRVRLFREVIEDTKEAVGDKCAVAVRFAVDELLGPKGITSENEGREVVEMLAELPDLWDVNISEWENDSATSRFEKEGYQEPYIGFVKSLTSKPVVGVGRYTSPDTMVSLIQRGVMDMIGAARPSIADPFLPNKIEEGRLDEIRECIGCNICVAGDWLAVPMRCTQNPTMGEEWRRGWHPERIEPRKSDEGVLVLGGGPAGLECALALGNRGYRVILAESSDELGGRVSRESRLPGLTEWGRVRDYRVGLLEKLENVSIYCGSELNAEDILEFSAEDKFGFSHVMLATGATWRRDGIAREHREPIPGLSNVSVLTPDDLMNGVSAKGKVLIFDDEHFYMGGVLAEKLKLAGHDVQLVTPAPDISTWTHNTMEQGRIQKRLLELDVRLTPQYNLVSVHSGTVELACMFTDRRVYSACDTLVLVTERIPNDDLHHTLLANPDGIAQAGIKTLQCIGDCWAPGIIAAAVHSGHLAAREFEEEPPGEVPFLRERVML
ncbi:MAG: FAD-dependent oxidoreductase [Deltaproteobacteria bacterium]|jgi:dimethylamine/trimethylamine dehydrogenase|nr:FAD-dependent oxidoreductase [Deltaproteobacteria bacterium]MBT4068242.1 FAD-dependent oxidoreductase [Candidatus Neomarinimicrobiota bacterium]MBT5177097.1 FAD-dependent oxidoreductase [Candidatus Neomarinimicrobiota bacterium]